MSKFLDCQKNSAKKWGNCFKLYDTLWGCTVITLDNQSQIKKVGMGKIFIKSFYSDFRIYKSTAPYTMNGEGFRSNGLTV